MKNQESQSMPIRYTQAIGGFAALSEDGRKAFQTLVAAGVKGAPAIADGIADRITSGRLKPSDRVVLVALESAATAAAKSGAPGYGEAGRVVRKLLCAFQTK